MWPRAVKLVRDFEGKQNPPRGDRSAISSFTQDSKRRLKFAAANAFPLLISQMALTYHMRHPSGREIKKDLNRFLTSLRREYPDVGSLWILEFQTRKTPHFHLFLTLPHTTLGLHRFMADKWHEIAEPDSREHLRFHRHERNFIPWDMGSGAYLCKYLDKEHQKAVPEGFEGVGRFWGASRNLVPPPSIVDMNDVSLAFSHEEVDIETGEVTTFDAPKYLTRQLCRHHEKSLRKCKWKSSARRRLTSYTLPNGTAALSLLMQYLGKQPRTDLPPF
jgi:hypothetical protein